MFFFITVDLDTGASHLRLMIYMHVHTLPTVPNFQPTLWALCFMIFLCGQYSWVERHGFCNTLFFMCLITVPLEMVCYCWKTANLQDCSYVATYRSLQDQDYFFNSCICVRTSEFESVLRWKSVSEATWQTYQASASSRSYFLPLKKVNY